jgi:hypothetical protein
MKNLSHDRQWPGWKFNWNLQNRILQFYRYDRPFCTKSVLYIFAGSTAPLGPGHWFFQFYDYFTDGRTAWTSDQPVTRPLPKHRTTQTQNKHIHMPNIHAFCGIRTHNPGFRESEDRSATVTDSVIYTICSNTQKLWILSTQYTDVCFVWVSE